MHLSTYTDGIAGVPSSFNEFSARYAAYCMACYDQISFEILQYRLCLSTVESQKKRTFICKLILERYIYLRNTQKQKKITNYVRNKNFLEVYLVYKGVCLKVLGSLL